MNDYLENDLKIGDKVVFVQKDYRNFMKGKIVSITPKTVLIEHEMTNTCQTQTRQYGTQVIKIEED